MSDLGNWIKGIDNMEPGVIHRSQRYTLIQDDGRWYMCPVDRREEALHYFAQIHAFWEASEEEQKTLTLPDDDENDGWLREINGPHTLSFTDPREE